MAQSIVSDPTISKPIDLPGFFKNRVENIGAKREALGAASTTMPVMISGESVTGKKLFAHAIHHASPRRHFPFFRVNCAALPKDRLETELFGYRLNGIPMTIVPFRERREDVIHMAYHFIEK